MLRFFSISLMLLTIGLNSHGQVNSSAFGLMLKTMIKGTVPAISVKELAEKDKSAILILDAREKNEYEVSHIKNAVWIGFETFDNTALDDFPKNQKIVVYCSIGLRSEKIGEKLLANGFTKVNNLYGSIFEWVNQGYPVFDINNEETQKVHAYNKIWGIWLNKGIKVY